MAKKCNIKKRFLAFIPGANIYYMGKLAGTSRVFGQKVKNAGVYAMIAETLATVLSIMVLAAMLYLQMTVGDPLYVDEAFNPHWDIIEPGFTKTVNVFYNVPIVPLIFPAIA